MGQLRIPVGHSLAQHCHAQQEIYYIPTGRAQRLAVGETEKNLKPGHTVFIPQDALHGLKSVGNGPFALLWIFPTDSWSNFATFIKRCFRGENSLLPTVENY